MKTEKKNEIACMFVVLYALFQFLSTFLYFSLLFSLQQMIDPKGYFRKLNKRLQNKKKYETKNLGRMEKRESFILKKQPTNG